jgi:hypothetical protein
LSPIILIVTLKEHKNPTGGKYMIFFPRVFIFSPLGHAIIVLSQMMYWGENIARGKSNHTMFHKNYGKLSKKCRP